MSLVNFKRNLPLDYKLSYENDECFNLSRLIVFGVNSTYQTYRTLRQSSYWRMRFITNIDGIGFADMLTIYKGEINEEVFSQRFKDVIEGVDLTIEMPLSEKLQFELYGERFVEEFVSNCVGELTSLKYYVASEINLAKHQASELLLGLSSIIFEEGVMDNFLNTLVDKLDSMMDSSICSMTLVKWCLDENTFEMPAVFEKGKIALGNDKFSLDALKSRPIYRVILNGKPFVMSKEENKRLISPVNIHGLEEASTAIIPIDLGEKSGALSISSKLTDAFSCRDLSLISSASSAVATIYRQNIIQSKMYQQANYDQLTGLANRAHFKRYLASMTLEGDEQASLLYIDLDKFKQVNDNYGHDVGDKYLKLVAKRIAAQLRDNDLPARIGGDEFVVIVNDVTSPDDSLRVAQRIVNAFYSPIEIDGIDHDAGVSIGICDFDSEYDVSLALTRADNAMYLAKSAGRGRFIKYQDNL